AAEALFRARLHPSRKPATLRPNEWRRLARGIRSTLKFALECEDSEEIEYVEEPGAENPFRIYGRAGEPCPACRTRVQSFTQGGRTTHFCPRCQPRKPKR
ncbi:MAG TPA: zinc finger domain-containing protein, partial [Myxococcaceae bacterium]|nr:zinc finger domain-containing protein [Myxococcaceae bacterium]